MIFQNSETKKYNHEIEEEKKKEEENNKDIIIKTNKFNEEASIIEQKLPNPYLDTDIMGNKKIYSMKVQSRYKSKFADYYEKKGNSYESLDNKKIKKIKLNKTYKYSGQFDKHINFTNLKAKYRAQSNKIILPQNLGKNIIKEENVE